MNEEDTKGVVSVPNREIVQQCSDQELVEDCRLNGANVQVEFQVERELKVTHIENNGKYSTELKEKNSAHATITVTANGVTSSADILVVEEGRALGNEDGVACEVSRVKEIRIKHVKDTEETESKISASRVRLRRVIPELYAIAWEPESGTISSPEEQTERSCCGSLLSNIYNNVTGDLKKLRNKCCNPRETWTANLKKARNYALKMLGSIVFPLFLDAVRDVWVAIEFILALVGLGLSIATLSLDHNVIFNILHLALAITSFTLSLFDLDFNRRCKSCKCSSTNSRAESCFSRVKKITDVLRAVVAEVLIYPLLMCNLLGVITGRGYEGKSSVNLLSFILFILSCFSLILYVYAVRILIMLKAITGRRSIGRPKQEWLNHLGNRYDPSLGKSGIQYPIWFFINVIFLMVIQVLMIIAVSMKMYSDNKHFYEKDNKDEEIRVTPVLWYMMACGYVAPFLGFLSYLMITMPWARDFFLGIFYDVVSLWKFWKKGGIDDLLPGSSNKEEADEDNEDPKVTSEMENRFARYFESFKQDLEKYRKMKFCYKVAYPFNTYIVFPFCVLYTWMQVFFAGFAAVTAFELAEDSPTWTLVYFVGVFFAGLFSIHTFIIGFMWSILLYNVIIAVALAIVFSPIIFCYYLQRGLNR